MPHQDDDTLLRVQDLHVEFSTRRGKALVLNGVDFEIRAGETLCVVGESGCGKSMTALALLRLIPSPPGRIAAGVELRHPGVGERAPGVRLTQKAFWLDRRYPMVNRWRDGSGA